MADELSDEELEEALEDLEIWGVQFGKLATKVEFDNYRDAVFFANTVFSIAEDHFHHPEVTVEYGAVSIDLWTHEVDGVTEKDIEMAREIEEKVRNIEWG